MSIVDRGNGGVVRTADFLVVAGFVALGSLAVAQAAGAQSAAFNIAQNGKTVGTASCDFVPTDSGIKSTSVVRVSMPGLEYTLSKTEELSRTRELDHVLLSAVVNKQAVTVTASPEAGEIPLDISANGRKTSTRLPAHAGAVFMPDFDPGALETLLALAVERNNRGLWALIPKKAGSIEPVVLATYEDQQGTLDGKSIVVHHLMATIAGTKTDLFSGADHELLKAELPQDGFALVRKGFVLKPASRAGAPPAR